MPTVYYDNELAAYDAAREKSKQIACGLYVDEDFNGFFVTPLGRPGAPCYFGGVHSSELEDDHA